MQYPDFFNHINTIKLLDPLSSVLGTFDRGELEISYLDVVKSSGHSCPTVAGAYLMSYHALKRLYPDSPAVRGELRVQISQGQEEGTVGVTSNVISIITGAADKSGFKGLNGHFARHSLMSFHQDVPFIRFTRSDIQKSVDVFYDPSSISVDPKQMQLLQTILEGQAKTEEKKEFAQLWQTRVKTILIENFDNDRIIRVKEV